MTKQEKSDELKNALLYLNVSELKETCERLNIPKAGEKIVLIERIITYVKKKKIIPPNQFPTISHAQKGVVYPLIPKGLILYGNYKNDLKTRTFMKELVGDHFHFTSYGNDWIKEQWYSGSRPTYANFAQFWQNEYIKRKDKPVAAKPELAYINFIQSYLAKKPKSSNQELRREWELVRQQNIEKVKLILEQLKF